VIVAAFIITSVAAFIIGMSAEHSISRRALAVHLRQLKAAQLENERQADEIVDLEVALTESQLELMNYREERHLQ
jgi:hypothetical protein